VFFFFSFQGITRVLVANTSERIGFSNREYRLASSSDLTVVSFLGLKINVNFIAERFVLKRRKEQSSAYVPTYTQRRSTGIFEETSIGVG
jgi:hypothetical protein